MKQQFSVEEVVVHRGKMSLLDSIQDYGEEWLEASVTIREEALFIEDGVMPSWVGVEYMAQAIGAHEGVRRRLQGLSPRLGFLVGTRKYVCNQTHFVPGDVLKIVVESEMEAENGLSVFSCRLTGTNIEANASLNVFQPDNAAEFLEENR